MDINPLDLLKEELDNDDTQIKVNAIHKLPVILAWFSQDKIINDLIPFIQKIITQEEDEVLLAISEELPNFKKVMDDSKISSLIPVFQQLLGSEETVVRRSAVEGMRQLIPTLTDSQVQKEIIPMALSISSQDAFQWKISACYLIRMCYPKAGNEKSKLRDLYFRICDDETPLIKWTAAKEFGPLCLYMEKEIVNNEMNTYYKKFMGESDSVRVTILKALKELTKIAQGTDAQSLNLQSVVAASEDKSWRVRNELAIIFPEFIDYFGNKINELVPTLSNLIKDSESEVKLSALKALDSIINKISAEKITACVVPSIRSLSNDGSKDVKSYIGKCFGAISRIIGYAPFSNSLGVMMDTLIKDENAEVRLGIAKSMFDIFVSSNSTLLPSTGALLGTMQKDSQYRIRECVYETLAKLGAQYGLEVFKANIESLYFNFWNDTVYSVRNVGIQSLKMWIAKFGNAWIVSDLIPKLQSYLNTPKISYWNRMCLIHAITTCTTGLEVKQINDFIVPNLIKGLKDKIANVRFYSIKWVKDIYGSLDGSGKEKIVALIKGWQNDDDIDVKYYACNFNEGK